MRPQVAAGLHKDPLLGGDDPGRRLVMPVPPAFAAGTGVQRVHAALGIGDQHEVTGGHRAERQRIARTEPPPLHLRSPFMSVIFLGGNMAGCGS
jgi:hypothetical protein